MSESWKPEPSDVEQAIARLDEGHPAEKHAACGILGHYYDPCDIRLLLSSHEHLRREVDDMRAELLVRYEHDPKVKALTRENERLRGLHLDLIMQVARKYQGESRHETAKRYIVETETRACESGAANSEDTIREASPE